MRQTDAASRAVNELRSSECEPKRVRVRAWYAILSTYEWSHFSEVMTNFGTAHNYGANRQSLSSPENAWDAFSVNALHIFSAKDRNE